MICPVCDKPITPDDSVVSNCAAIVHAACADAFICDACGQIQIQAMSKSFICGACLESGGQG